MKILALAGLAVLASGCFGGPQPDGTAPVPIGAATLKVDNRSFADMRLVALWQGREEQLGRARANALTHLRIPETLVAEGGRHIRFRVDPVATNVHGVTQELRVFPGDTVSLIIPPA